MKISVILPTFNRDHLIKRSIESVLTQTHKDLELIIVDDGSTDGTYQLVKEYLVDSRVRYIYQANSGVSSARNLGSAVSKYEWISFLDSDDEWLDYKLEEQVKLSHANPHYSFIHSEENWIRNGKKVNKPKQYKKYGGNIFSKCISLCAISPSTVLMRKELFNEMSGFSTDYIVCEDFDLWLKVTSLYEVGLVEASLINKYGGHDDQLSMKFFAMDLFRVRALSNILNMRDFSDDIRGEVISVIIKKCEILLNGYIKHNNLDNYKEVEDLLSRFQS